MPCMAYIYTQKVQHPTILTFLQVVPTITRRRRQTTNTKVEVEVEVAPDKNRVTIDNLSPDDSYTVSVRANTAAGKGVNSDPITSSGTIVIY